jgi:diketogulonate reductase-like aldo/keto reductase
MGIIFLVYNCGRMRYENIGGLQIPRLGLGTWRMGNDRRADSRSLAALRAAFEAGYSHLDTAEMYADGHAEELIGQAIRALGVRRESLFITSKVQPSHLRYDDVLRSCAASLKRLGTDYLDLYLIHWPSPGMKLPDTFRALNELVKDGRVKHLGVSNFDLRLLKQSIELCETPLLTNQVPYSLSDRRYAANGVLDYCQRHDILLTAYSPLDEGRLNISPALRSAAEARGATPYQMALAWLVAQPRVITIPMSLDPGHIRENLAAADMILSDQEMKKLS